MVAKSCTTKLGELRIYESWIKNSTEKKTTGAGFRNHPLQLPSGKHTKNY